MKNTTAQSWIIPCNLDYYDVIGAFKHLKKVDWKQSATSIQPGDVVYIYVGKPIKAILYKCTVNKVCLPEEEIDDSEFVLNGENYEHYGRYMELEVIREFKRYQIGLDILKENGLKGNIQGPRRVDPIIQVFIDRIEHEE